MEINGETRRNHWQTMGRSPLRGPCAKQSCTTHGRPTVRVIFQAHREAAALILAKNRPPKKKDNGPEEAKKTTRLVQTGKTHMSKPLPKLISGPLRPIFGEAPPCPKTKPPKKNGPLLGPHLGPPVETEVRISWHQLFFCLF